MTRDDVIAALAEQAATRLLDAVACEQWDASERKHDPEFAELSPVFAAEHRADAGVCIAAINHLNGVSPE